MTFIFGYRMDNLVGQGQIKAKSKEKAKEILDDWIKQREAELGYFEEGSNTNAYVQLSE